MTTTARKRATARGVGTTIGGAVAILIVWAASLEPTNEQMAALTVVCGAALEWLAGRLR